MNWLGRYLDRVLDYDYAAYPPSFEGNPAAYGWALFSLTTTSLLAFFVITELARIQISSKDPLVSPVAMARSCYGFAMMAIFLGAWPDAIVLLAWGEVQPNTLATLMLIDRIFDGTTLYAVSLSLISYFFGGETITYQLIRRPLPGRLISAWPQLVRPAAAVGVILLISVLVTLGK